MKPKKSSGRKLNWRLSCTTSTLQMRDLHAKLWAQNDPRCPVMRCIQHFNAVSTWVIRIILTAETPEKRARMIDWFRQLACVCGHFIKVDNFATAISSAAADGQETTIAMVIARMAISNNSLNHSPTHAFTYSR